MSCHELHSILHWFKVYRNFLVSLGLIIESKLTTLSHSLHSYRSQIYNCKILSWNHLPKAHTSTWVLNIKFLQITVKLKKRPWKNVFNLLNSNIMKLPYHKPAPAVISAVVYWESVPHVASGPDKALMIHMP